MEGSSGDLLTRYGPQLGEIAQHEINVDMKIAETSDWYVSVLDGVFKRNPAVLGRGHGRPRMLEIACYRHILSYRLAKERDLESTLFDISDQDLRVGAEIAAHHGVRDQRL